MGCWNQTCALTQLPIRSGDKVVFLLIALRLTNEANSYCYSNGWGYPITVPMRGEYDDYGGVENVEWDEATRVTAAAYGKPNLADFTAWVNDTVNDPRKDEPVYHDAHRDYRESQLALLIDLIQQRYGHDPIIWEKETLEKMGAWDKQQTVQEIIDDKIKDQAKSVQWAQPDRVGLWMVHEWAWKHITRSKDFVTGWGYSDLDREKNRRNELRKQAAEMYEELLEYHSGDDEDGLNELNAELDAKAAEQGRKRRRYVLHPLFMASHDNSFAYALSGMGSDNLDNAAMEKYRDAFDALAEKGADFKTSPELKSLVDGITDLYIAMRSMNGLRRGFVPQAGAGSQSHQYILHHSLLTKAAKKIEGKARQARRTGYDW